MQKQPYKNKILHQTNEKNNYGWGNAHQIGDGLIAFIDYTQY